MTRNWLLLSTLVITQLYMMFSTTIMVTFPFSDQIITQDTHWWMFFEHLQLILFAMAFLVDAKEYRRTLWVFLSIQVVDTVDYMLTYSEPWTWLPLTFNHLKVIAFCLTFGYDYQKKEEWTQ